MADSPLAAGFVVASNVTVQGKIYPIEFVPYADTNNVFVTRTIWATFIVKNSLIAFLRANDIDSRGVIVADPVK